MTDNRNLMGMIEGDKITELPILGFVECDRPKGHEMTDSERKRVQTALSAAAETNVINLSGLAAAVGWTQQSMSKFRTAGVGGAEKVEKLANLLSDLGLYDAKEMKKAESIPPELAQVFELVDIARKVLLEERHPIRSRIVVARATFERLVALLQEMESPSRP